MSVAFDVISDLKLSKENKLDWEGKPTSLFCIIAGNISDDLEVLKETLSHLSLLYHGVFFIDGALEIGSLSTQAKKIDEIANIVKEMQNVVYLHNNVVIIDGIAIVGINGWYGNKDPGDPFDMVRLEYYMHEEAGYLHKTIEKLQLHVDVKQIVVVSNSVPIVDLFYNQNPYLPDTFGLITALMQDTERKVHTWVYGSSDKMVDAVNDGIRFVNNGCFDKQPYWPKRIEIDV